MHTHTHSHSPTPGLQSIKLGHAPARALIPRLLYLLSFDNNIVASPEAQARLAAQGAAAGPWLNVVCGGRGGGCTRVHHASPWVIIMRCWARPRGPGWAWCGGGGVCERQR